MYKDIIKVIFYVGLMVGCLMLFTLLSPIIWLIIIAIILVAYERELKQADKQEHEN